MHREPASAHDANLAHFLDDTFALLVEAARKATLATSLDSGDAAFASGEVMAYHDAITLVQQQLIAFGLQGRFQAIITFDATSELLGGRRPLDGP